MSVPEVAARRAGAEVPAPFAEALRELGLAGAEPLRGEPLTGGVSSDIWRIDTARGPVCVKRALAKLRVAADWRAPIERNLYEARWMQVAGEAVPGCAPRVLGQHPALGVLVMDYLPPADYPLWKDLLRRGHAEMATARAVGQVLGLIHAYSAARPELASQFDSDAIFFDIRLEPYLLATARRHPDLAPAIEALVAATRSHRVALVHGDVSPKNILVGPNGPVLLDAECAWWGDPAFDIAFCLNHLLLKCLWNPPATAAFLDCFRSARGEPISTPSTGSRATRSSGARLRFCPDCCSRASTASRRSNTSPTRRSASSCGGSRGAASRSGRAAARGQRRMARGASSMSDTTIRRDRRATRLGQPRPADGRGRGDAARTARSAWRSRRPAPPRGRARRTSCATAARRSAAST